MMKEEKEHLLSRGTAGGTADYSADDESTGVYSPPSMQRHQNFLSPSSASMLGLLPPSHAKFLTRSSSSAALTISTNYPTSSNSANLGSSSTTTGPITNNSPASGTGNTLKKIRAKLSSSSLGKRDNDPLSHDFTKYFNMRNAKLIVVLLITLFVFYHGSLNSFYGRNSCNRLLGEGHLTDDSEWQPFGCMIHKYSKNDIQMCYKYYQYFNEKNSFVFIGDMRTRQVYHAFIKQFDKDYKLSNVKTEAFEAAIQDYLAGSSNNYSHLNLNYTDKTLNLEINFFWKPLLDESVNNMIESYLQPTGPKPNFIVLGTAIPYFYFNSSKKALEWFKGNMTNLVDTIKSLNYDYKYPLLKKEKTLMSSKRLRTPNSAKQTQTPNTSNEPSSTSSASESSSSQHNPDSSETITSIYWMLQDPMDEYKYFLNRNYSEKITNRKIDMFNRESINLLYRSPINTWSSARLVSQAYSKDSPDGLQIGPFALDIDSQILYNLYCNNRMNFNDASCCSQPESISLIQLVLFCIYLVIFLLTFILVVYKNSCKTYSNFRVNISGKEIGLTTTCKNAASSSTFYKFLKLFSKLALIMFYFFACDRANYFMKENKHYTLLTFLIPLLYITVIGLFFHDNLPSAKVMNKYQTYELKGLMQIVILLYKMSNAQQSTPLYLLMSLFTSAYLFLSGYGHFMYFWNSSSFQITRFFEVVFRLNFLPIMLCFTMNRMYQFYSFIPLITFWFVASYLLMIMYPRVSARTAKDNYFHYFYMIIKLGVFLGLISLLNFSESIFERVFLARLWKFLFVSSDDLIDEWRSRWTHDCYSFALGMCFAHLICILKRLNLIDESSSLDTTSNINATTGNNGSHSPTGLVNSDNSDSIKLINTGASSSNSGESTNMEIMEFSDNRRKTNSIWNIKIKFILMFMSMCGLVSYLMLIILCQSRDICDNIMAYLTVIPIVSYFVLRNSIQCLSDKCSFMFVWFGRIALELYICSYHIWSAADSNGMLVILPGYPVVNVLLTTFIFICLSHELNCITRELGEIIMPRDNWRVCVRNVLAFIILLMPVAIKYGYI